MELTPISFKDACDFVSQYHRHHKKPQGHKFSIAAMANNQIVGVVMVGRPVSRVLDNGITLEVTRLCTKDYKNVCSFLYSAAWRVTKNLGYKKLITFILETERGTSLLASGWKCLGGCGGGTWDTPSRTRIDKHPIMKKVKFEIAA